MRVPRPIRHGMLTVAILGMFTAALSAAALYRVIAFSMTQRLERAREAVGEELAILRDGAARNGGSSDNLTPAMIGMRGGLAVDPEALVARAPLDWRAPLAEAAARARREQRGVDVERPNGGTTLVGRVEPLPSAGAMRGSSAPPGASDGGRLAWVAVAVKPSVYSQSWRLLVGALTVSALLLVASAAHALITVKRGAGGLQVALAALANDLSTPVPRPPVRELSAIADGIATLARRLAEARQIQERLGRDLAKQERLVALGRVVAGVAHEVRNPLASIKLRLDLAMTGDARQPPDALPPAAIQAIAHASSEITRLDRLVADLLIVSGRALGPQRATDMGALLRARVDALAPWCALRGVTVQTTGADGGPIPTDQDAMARALDNLLRNAIEASPHGGTVIATVHEQPDGGGVRVRIQDAGAGVPAGRVGELFEPFFTTKPEGTGLGLAISRAIVRAHGGEVIYAREHNMTQFEMTLSRPAAPAMRPAEEPRA